MNKASVTLLFIICILFFGILFFVINGNLGLDFMRAGTKAISEINSKLEPTIAGDIMIAEENINHGSEYLTTDICKPIISGFDDERFEQTLNDSINKQITLAANAAEQAAGTFWEDTKAQGYEPWAYIFYAGYEAKSVHGVLSLKVTTLLNTGGPGLPHTIYYNADIKGNKFICLDDLFLEEAAYKERIDSIIIKEMDKDPERFFVSFTGVTKDTQFFIFEGKLYIAFAKYEIASGMTGELKFLIPTEKIRDILAKEYKNILNLFKASSIGFPTLTLLE